MKFWNSEIGFDGENVPAPVEEIANELRDVLLTDGGCPRLLRIGYGDGYQSWCRYVVEVELAPGLVLPIEYGLQEGLDDGSELEEDDVTETVAAVCEGIVEALPVALDLSAIVHAARVQARRIVGEWNAQGVPTRLIDVQLAPFDHWRGAAKPGLRVIVEELDGTLQPAPMIIGVDEPSLMAAAMAEWRDGIAHGYAQRARFARLGASGTVSRLALNAMGHYGDVAETLRRFAGEWRFWLPDDTALIMTAGAVRAGSGDPDARFDWWDGHVNVSSLYSPLEDLLACVGQPVSTLIDHEFLSDDLIVTGASTSFEGGRPIVTIEFTNPTLLFCSTTGWAWEDDRSDVDTVAPTETPSANVVQFPRKARG